MRVNIVSKNNLGSKEQRIVRYYVKHIQKTLIIMIGFPLALNQKTFQVCIYNFDFNESIKLELMEHNSLELQYTQY